MSDVADKISLSPSRDIPFNKLVLSQSNIRQVKAGLSIEQLAESIAQKTLLQSLSVRAIVDANGAETGMYEVPAGGRRFRALQLLVKQKRMAKTQPVPCIVREGGFAEDDSLTENIERADLHPLDQYRAFQALRDKGLEEEDIAARQFVSVNVVKQRLKLAAVSPKLLDIYAEDAMSFEQLMAFTVNCDHARQEQVWDTVSKGWNRQGYYIKRLLTEGAVNAGDRRVQFVGLHAYEAAGGIITRDLFEEDGGGWLQDVPLLERLVADRLKVLADQVQSEGWRWVETAVDFPYGHTAGLRQLVGVTETLDDDDKAARAALQAEYDQLLQEHQGDLPDEVDARLGELERMIALFDDLPMCYAEEEMTRAGVFIRLNGDGSPDIARGFVRYEDEPRAEAEGEESSEDTVSDNPEGTDHSADPGNASNEAVGDGEDDEELGSLRPLSERLKLELTAHRTLALRDALANDPQAALLVLLHTLVLGLFYPGRGHETCLEIGMRQTSFSAQAPGLAESLSARAIEARAGAWREQLPQDADGVWDAISALDPDSRHMLLAHCLSQGVNAQHDPWGRGGRRRSADQLAECVNLDMVTAGWQPTVDNYLGRVPKPRILEAVAEGRDQRAADRIAHMKKLDMAKEAETLLSGRGWLPDLLRQPNAGLVDHLEPQTDETGTADPDTAASSMDADATPAIAAE